MDLGYQWSYFKGECMNLTIEDMLLCNTNAQRLYADSRNEHTSAPTRAALLELAYEECAKSMMIFLWLWQHDGIPRRSVLDGVNFNLFDNDNPKKDPITESDIKDAFKYHPVKLKFIKQIASFFSVQSLDKLKTIPEFNNIVRQTVELKLGHPITEDLETKLINTFFDQIKSKFIDLHNKVESVTKEIKEHGFYVDYLNGTCVPPSEPSPEDIDTMRLFIETNDIMIKLFVTEK